LVSTEVVVRGCVGVRESNTRRRFQEDHISHYIPVFVYPIIRVPYELSMTFELKQR
jgi:hypothetical protein